MQVKRNNVSQSKGGVVSRFDKVLRPGETVRKSAGVSTVSLIAGFVVVAVVVFAYWLAMQYLLSLGSDSQVNSAIRPFSELIMNILTAILAVACLWQMLLIAIRSMFTFYGLTESRVLKRSLLRVRGADLAHVQDVEVSQGLLGKLLGYGDVMVRTASTDGTVVLRRVDNPHDWFREIDGRRR